MGLGLLLAFAMVWAACAACHVMRKTQGAGLLGLVYFFVGVGCAGLAAKRLHLEVTESSLMDDPHAAAALLGTLRAMGVTIAIDDFGTGFSSISYLDSLPLDVVKIDRSFVRNVTEDSRRLKLLKGTVHLARSLGLGVVVEGVETPEQLQVLIENDCADLVQGYVFSRPLSRDAVLDLMQK